ncbi:hypothetical protein M9H77_16705 [Catharanthus roseus]|uniref:Uncharacterized protein n=1 Tax=Catharanthus roseus TaxID=4058 RepID=A0ACC0B2H1_CATRO|nr:hypothetical protein M9H77_16705 [Catharanthus roseus]
MVYNWSNSSWKRIEVKSKQEDYQSKLTRDMHNFYHGFGNGFNAYGGNNHGIRNLTSRRHVGAEFSKLNELRQATIEVEESDVLHVKEELSNVEHCDFMNGMNNVKEEYIEIQEKERVEEKQRLVERSCIFDSFSTLSKESELLQCLKEKESDLEKSERKVREKEEQREKKIVVFEKSEELNFYANETNSFFASNPYVCRILKILPMMEMESLLTSPSRPKTSFL